MPLLQVFRAPTLHKDWLPVPTRGRLRVCPAQLEAVGIAGPENVPVLAAEFECSERGLGK